ncbi:60 kDa SS-A/Ro ribonucleoprotein-like isoform X2 [Xenia sp. Carnegie-2017]|nr:60 kDa SS-A/Ro ribonucleoprotein-like isoform X2 [Xenia sp. Carnegie-2017]
MPYLHLYLEVDKEMRQKNVLKQEINKIFNGNASEYIELRFVGSSDEIIIRPLSNMVHSKRDDEPNEESRGTLTLFSCKDGKHYALTCLHVGYGTVPKGADQFFYIRDKIKNDKLAFEKFLQKNKYSYTHKNSIKIPLVELFHYSFDLETDIMAILIDDKESEFTAAEIEMPSSFDAVFDNLLSKANEKVYKVDDEFGLNVIADLSRSVFDNNNKIVFRDVVAVKSDKEFLRPGESGCLVYYYDENNKKIPFAYGVAAVTKKNETYYVCMRLKDGLENLGLLENVSFKDFSVENKRVKGRKNKENPSHDVFLKDGLDMEEDEDVAQSLKLDSFHKSSIQSSAGGFVWKVGDMDRFRRFLVLGSDKGTFYIDERTLGLENATVVVNLLEAGKGVEVVNEIEKYSIEGRTLRQQAIMFSLALCARKGDLATKRQAYDALPKVCRIPTHLFMFIEFCKLFSQPGKGWGRAHRNAIKRWYKEKDPWKLAMDLTKYHKREGWSHRDVARLMHLKPEGTDVSDELFVIMKYAVCGWQKLFEYFFPEDRTVLRLSIGENGKAMLVFFKAVENLKSLQEEARVVELINQHDLVREHIPTHWLNSKEVWRALAQKMPMTAMLQNLGKMTIVELLDEQLALSRICEKLLNEEQLKRARIHPFNVLVALKTYMDGHGDRGRLTWNPNEAIVNALEEAFYLSFKLIQPTNKRYMLALDVSGSMSYSGCAGTPCLAPCVAAAAMSMVTARTESKHLFVAFSYKIVPLMISSDMTLDEVLELMELIPNGGTDCAQPMLYAIKNNLEVDVFIVYTDSETKAGFIHPSEALKRYRQLSGIQAKLIVVAMTSNGFTIADPEDIGMLDIVGFDLAAPQVMREFISR